MIRVDNYILHTLWVIQIPYYTFRFNKSPGYFLIVYKLGSPRLPK